MSWMEHTLLCGSTGKASWFEIISNGRFRATMCAAVRCQSMLEESSIGCRGVERAMIRHEAKLKRTV